MVIYEVNLSIEADIAAAFQVWLRQHVAEMLQLPGFVKADIWVIEADQPAHAGLQLSVQYVLSDRAALADYFSQHAARMRADGVQRFGDAFKAERRILLPF